MVVLAEPAGNWGSRTLAYRIRAQDIALPAVAAMDLVVAQPPPEAPLVSPKRNQTHSSRLMSLTFAVEPLGGALAQLETAVDLVAVDLGAVDLLAQLALEAREEP